MKGISFELSSNFGFFHWGKTKGDKRISNLFISRTEVLGILGCVIGLEGYTQGMFKQKFKQKSEQTFYEVLGGLNVSIIPKSVPSLFEDQLIHRHMKHINTKGSLMVTMTGLVKPKYQIILERGTVTEDVFNKLVLYLENGWSEYIPYFGKNQFPLEISNVERVQLEEETEKDTHVIHSLYLQKKVVKEPKVSQRKLIRDGYYYSEGLKNFVESGSPSITSEQTIWSSFEVGLETPVYQSEHGEKIVFL